MFGTGPIPPPPPALGRRVATLLLRAFFTVVPLATIGILAWVPMLRLAIGRGRFRDWIWFGVVAVLSTGSFVLVGSAAEDSAWQNTGGFVLVSDAVFACVYFLVSDLRRQDERRVQQHLPYPPYGAYPPPAAPAGRIVQVRAELDELSAYLRRQEGR
ncbi:hypothetical protein ABIA33_005686 [Streptacidiphilus sp. MAP12-16]|uniref:hypothetical protein n=1 Tax=Streptacidiphilus sp. MAP12-16 TaxID=3156300 RepID=UPI0035150CE0